MDFKSCMSEKKEVLLKLFLFFCLPVVLAVYFLMQLFSPNPRASAIKKIPGLITYRVSYKNSLDPNLGYTPEPIVTFPLKTSRGYTNTSFLLDTGAIISTLPLQTAKDLGVNLLSARRINLQGFGGMSVFAYLDNITIQIDGSEFVLPATFSEISKANILGRKGLLDYFTINFDSENKLITLSRKTSS